MTIQAIEKILDDLEAMLEQLGEEEFQSLIRYITRASSGGFRQFSEIREYIKPVEL
jgi:hypothetical protein